MAASPDQLKKILTDAGLKVSTAYLRRTGSSPFTPRALILHHDAAGLSYVDSYNGQDNTAIAAYMANPANLGAQFWVGRSGTWYILDDARRSHAGNGGPYGNIPFNSGNQYSYGVETDYGPVRANYSGPRVQSAGYTWPVWDPKHVVAINVGTAALCRALSLTTQCGHKEYAPTRKIDPANFNLNIWRAYIKNPTQPDPDTGDDDMPLSSEDIKKIGDEVMKRLRTDDVVNYAYTDQGTGKETSKKASVTEGIGSAASSSGRAAYQARQAAKQ